jgi:hypothetical protein
MQAFTCIMPERSDDNSKEVGGQVVQVAALADEYGVSVA